jgi:methylenetetrahydrofolate dehydrogenase (NADP+)/methenyltetrahydrofolate cyclohydrolase
MLLNIKELCANEKKRLKDKIAGKEIRFTIIQVGEVEASNRYVRNKLKDCAEVGISANLIHLDESITSGELQEVVNTIHNPVIVQLPLPANVRPPRIPLKYDVDGFETGSPYIPCTPGGILWYLRECGFKFAGKKAVVIGRSKIVGKPVANLLLDEDMTVTICHSKTKQADLCKYLKDADLVVCAVGKANFLDANLAPNAIIVDVGINFDEDGKLVGDVFVSEKSQNRVTPVPGGVGLLTRMQLVRNLVEKTF